MHCKVERIVMMCGTDTSPVSRFFLTAAHEDDKEQHARTHIDVLAYVLT